MPINFISIENICFSLFPNDANEYKSDSNIFTHLRPDDRDHVNRKLGENIYHSIYRSRQHVFGHRSRYVKLISSRKRGDEVFHRN